MKKVSLLIAGLGNPGKKYSENRHNIGWMVATALAEKYQKPVMQWSPIYLQAAMRIKSELVLAILPTTYMNRSGVAVKAAMDTFDVDASRLLVIADEYNFPVGKVRLKRDGGDGGHNGIASIIDEIQATDFLRLRCGIGRDFGPGEMPDYVLSNFKNEEIESRNLMIKKAVDAIEAFFRFNENRAMSEINSEALWKKSEE